MSFQIKKARRTNTRIKMALIGISGSGKTYSALAIAKGLGERVLLVDTEHGSASKYEEFDFDTIELENFDPRNYVECINLAQAEGYDVLILDSLSHAWTGKGGALEMVDNASKRANGGGGNSFGAWRNVTPLHNQLIDAIVGAKIHLIATMRAKTEYVQEKDERSGKTTVRKVGLAPVQRDQMEYEFDIVGDLNQDHELIVTKSRCFPLSDQVIPQPGAQVATTLRNWLAGDGPSEVGADETAPQCYCEIPARFVKGKSGSGWMCGYHGTDTPMCSFKQKAGASTQPTSSASAPAVAPPAAPAPVAPQPAPVTPPVTASAPSTSTAATTPPADGFNEDDPFGLEEPASPAPSGLLHPVPPDAPRRVCDCGVSVTNVDNGQGGTIVVNLDGTPHAPTCQADRTRPASTDTPLSRLLNLARHYKWAYDEVNGVNLNDLRLALKAQGLSGNVNSQNFEENIDALHRHYNTTPDQAIPTQQQAA